jgi:hypothetical protein
VDTPAWYEALGQAVNLEGIPMSVKRIVTSMMAGCAAILISAVPVVAAQAPQPVATAKAKPTSDMAAKCKAMMAEREQMMANAKAADQRLDALVVKMNAASGAEKADATAAVVWLVAGRRSADGPLAVRS